MCVYRVRYPAGNFYTHIKYLQQSNSEYFKYPRHVYFLFNLSESSKIYTYIKSSGIKLLYQVHYTHTLSETHKFSITTTPKIL